MTLQYGLTTKQIYDLDNSMVAAQNVSLGTIVSGLMTDNEFSIKGAPDSFIGKSDVLTTGSIMALTTMDFFGRGDIEFLSVVCSLSGSPTSDHFMSTAVISGSATVDIYQWKLSAGNIVASGSAGAFVPVSAIAYGAIHQPLN